jgi:hypothetical protein
MIQMKIGDHLLVPFGCPKWDIGKIKIAGVSTTATYFQSETPCAYLDKSVNKALRFSDWQRHEENVAKIRHESPGQVIWDIGLGPRFKRAIPTEELKATLDALVTKSPPGLAVLNFGGLPPVYVFKDDKQQRIDVGLRQDMVAWKGEEWVSKCDAIIFGEGR